jgi:hypothetical protein
MSNTLYDHPFPHYFCVNCRAFCHFTHNRGGPRCILCDGRQGLFAPIPYELTTDAFISRAEKTLKRREIAEKRRVEVGQEITDVYHHYGDNGTLLYVGRSYDVRTRIKSHRRSIWWQQVRLITVDHYPSLEDALTTEAIAIIDKKPLYNDVIPADPRL